MKIESIKVKNFRGYKDEVKVGFDNLTLIVGKNDIGKSTILEAANIFFGNQKTDKDDLNNACDPSADKIEIAVEFSSFPNEIDIDAGAKTSLEDEFLLNSDGNLEVRKVIAPGSAAQPKLLLNVNMPNESEVLVVLKNTELKNKATELNVDPASYNASINNTIRKAIWAMADTSNFEERLIDINKEDGKKIYEKLELEFPIFTLFSADRKNTDQDEEVQAPIKSSIKELVHRLSSQFEPLRQEILKELDSITTGTIEKLSEMNPEVAQTLKSKAEKPAWEKAFTVNIESDGIPLNKRGSGVKRLVLINFFRQEAERRRDKENKVNVFYAIEEPETSQHPDWQVKLFDAFKELTEDDGVQIAITSHHPELCGLVSLDNIRLIKKDDEDKVVIKEGCEDNYKEISNTLGVLPKLDGAKVVVGVEGPNDVTFLKNISAVFGLDGDSEKIFWAPLGGGTLRDYVSKGYLDSLDLPQVHFFDRDEDSKYKDDVDTLKEKGCWAELSNFLTMENYIHPKYYIQIWPSLTNSFTDYETDDWATGWEDINIPNDLSDFVRAEFDSGNKELRGYCKERIKKHLADVASEMKEEDFTEMGTYDELKALFDEIKRHI
jgi:putative ATP-dependent endonuclease of OLD family